MQVLVLTDEYQNKGEVLEVSQTAFARDLYIDSQCRVYDLSLAIPEIIPIGEISKAKNNAKRYIENLQEVIECIETYENPIEKQRIK